MILREPWVCVHRQSGEAMATFTVTSLSDVSANDGVTTLREAIELSNISEATDTIVFDASLAGGLLRLAQGEMSITDGVTIDASGMNITITGDTNDNDSNVAGTDLTDVDASSTGLSDNTRIFDITGNDSDTTIVGLTLTGGRSSGIFNAGGAISSEANLTLEDVTVYGNITEGSFSGGGGVHGGRNVTLIDSTIEGNRTTGDNSDGGGVQALIGLYVTNSTIHDNGTTGGGSDGGGIASASLELVNSTVSDNSTTGVNADGGGIATEQTATLVNATLTNNTTSGDNSDGGGIYSFQRVVAIHSTISGNSNAGSSTSGGGIKVEGFDIAGMGGLELINSIVSGNVNTSDATTSESLVSTDFGGTTTLTGANIVGDTIYSGSTSTGTTTAAGLFGATQLTLIDSNGDGDGDTSSGVSSGVLGDNGGTIETIAILAGGSAQDAGDAAAGLDVLDVDEDLNTTEALPTDAVGENRTADAGPDLGALELAFDGIIGTNNDDVLDGTDDAEAILGEGGNDRLNGRDGNDTLDGGTGNDTLNGQGGDDTMSGGPGNDRYFVDSAGDVVIEQPGEGTDILTTSVSYTLPENIETASTSGSADIDITGNGLNNNITGNASSNVLIGEGGNDRLRGRDGDDTLEGGAGNDILEPGTGMDVLRFGAGDGDDTVFDFELGVDVLDFSELGLRFVDLALLNAAGSTRIEYPNGLGGTASITLDGISVEQITSTIMADPTGAGSPGGGVTLFEGDTGNNNIAGSGAGEDFVGGVGNDVLNARGGDDTMVGGLGDDQYFVEQAGDVVIEQANQGYDTVRSALSFTLGANIEAGTTRNDSVVIDITGNELNNALTGNSQSNTLIDDLGRDRLRGRGGDDTLNAGADNDVLEGGTGADVFVFDADHGLDLITDFEVGVDVIDLTSMGIAYADLRIQDGPLGAQVYTDLTPGSTDLITLTGVQASQLLLDSFITVFGNNQPPITGTSGNDNLNGSQIDDELRGLGGNDRINGQLGADTALGGPGDDEFTIDNPGDIVIELAGEGTDLIRTEVDLVLPDNVENANASAGTGQSGISDPISLTGNALDNRLNGNDANNALSGEGGNDDLQGREGTDTLDGGTGDDVLRGGADADTFVFEAGDGLDQITDFEVGVDTIDLSATGLSYGDLTIEAAGASSTVTYGTDVITVFNVLDTELDANQFAF